ncbi:MAG: PepSY domain-containing protein [Rhizobiaceae bacterium]
MNMLVKSTIAAAMIITPSWVLASMSPGDVAGKSEAEIRESLEAAGYSVKKIETEDGEFEVHAELDGKLLELEISAKTGEILEIELEEDDEADDD